MDRADLLGKLNKDNSDLQRLVQGSIAPKPAVASYLKKSEAKLLESIRLSAKSMYSALCTRWYCDCQRPHIAYMRLQHRDPSSKDGLRFDMVFSYSNNTTGAASEPLRWKEIDIEPGDDDIDQSPTSAKVSFIASISTVQPSSKRITDMCHSLQDSKSGPDCIRFIDEQKRKHYLYLCLSSPLTSEMRKPVSLFDLLSRGGKVTDPLTLEIYLLDRYQLALILASSVLQLHTTSWQIAIRNETIFALGKTLLELSIGATLESRQVAEDNINELIDCATARRLQKEPKLQRENVKEWNEVVERCLHCQFRSSPDLQKDSFRQEFYHDIIAPLQKLYEDAK
ncbi:MAG: hypothetical protein M1813_007852 [Trichoglossum hirsutum]|nr:MAG: hypothetical protein M1813_007852 [Trichoglossum hirsutum]